MKVLYCASEALPFLATGGLADVAGSLPKALVSKKVSCRVVLPLYDSISQEMKDKMKFVTSISVPVAWRRQYCGVYEARVGDVIYYLIDNQYYFKRTGGIYGHFDDAERFAFFSRAILEMLPYVDFKPDVIHANDWQTALVSVYYRLFYANSEWYSGIKTLFTIHNIQYQGQYGMDLIEDVLGIPYHDKDLIEFDNSVNLMKGAIECSNWVSTVSPSYAKEILDPWFSHKLDSILKERAWKLSGILNGIDVESYNPETDKVIHSPFTTESLQKKADNKRELQKELGLQQNDKVPLIGMVTRLVSHKGLDLVKEGIDNIMQYSNAQVAILGSGDKEYEEHFCWMQEKYPERFVIYVGFVPTLSRKIYAGSDLFLMPSKSEPCGLSQMIALRYGSIPVVRKTGGLNDSISDVGDGKGNGYTFTSYSTGDMVNTLHRALHDYNSQPEKWKEYVAHAMQCDNSWKKSADEYISLYQSLLKR
ncbi:glycogen synthase GlgA [Scatolibacter rhodanostii]|uniref:glycogen synthase GlgA n=1 Tax=Scatolibacter rhodanostii TaxID=2014781 RepID=UPI000C074FDC|nr:glycogen synthase GlgA [Scatolibacter rhodanostii]